MSKYLEKLNGNGLFEDAQSKTISIKSSHNDSEFSSKEMKELSKMPKIVHPKASKKDISKER